MVVLRIARARGLRLPGDLSVTGYSNGSLSAFADPPLTTVDQSFYEMGRVAAAQVIGFAESGSTDSRNVQSSAANETVLHPPVPTSSMPPDQNKTFAHREIQIPPRLIERESTAPPVK
jgi:LacI family transcriptional regulator